MLVLGRRKDQTIVIDNITITVLRISGGQVRLGIEAPRGVAVVRGEILARYRHHKEFATKLITTISGEKFWVCDECRAARTNEIAFSQDVHEEVFCQLCPDEVCCG